MRPSPPRSTLSTLLTLLCLAACGADVPPPAPPPPPPPPPPSGPTTPPPAVRDDGRLPATVTPTGYALTLRVDPSQPRFSGVATLRVDVPSPTSYVVLNARDLTVSRVVAHENGKEVPATSTARLAHEGVVPEELVLSFAAPLDPGPAEIEITYDAPFASDLAGLYRVEEGGAYYAYTQFESTDARRAFPCFDEPAFKTPYDLTLVVPRALRAFANAPEAAHEDVPEPEGWVAHRFATSKPMPSYLVAWTVGDLDVAEGQASPVPIRVITTKGKAGLTKLALDASAALVAKIAEYLDTPYPYPKLDLVAVPDFSAGAMENPGLITFRDLLLLLDPARATAANRREQAITIAHEIAHHWFGDLVTMEWWDDVWLNEGLATWAESKMVDLWKPSFGATVEAAAAVGRAMDTDSLGTARAVREPVTSSAEAEEAFDGLTYDKGGAVLRMIESWLGADTFRRGVQRYVKEHAWKNARAQDLFAALDFVSTEKVGDLASAFVDRPGVPSVLLSWKCVGGDTKVDVQQSEWRPMGAGGQRERTWTLPVCVATDTKKAKTCFTLGAKPITRDLGAGCATFVYPNAEQAGYYRFVLDPKQLMALARGSRRLNPVDRLGLVSDSWAAVRQGALDPSALLDVLPLFDADPNRFVLQQIATTLESFQRALVTPSDAAAFRRYVAGRFAARKPALGWEARPGEDDDRALARRDVLWTMGRLVRDDATLTEAERYAQRWLRDPASVPDATASIAVPLASLRAGAARLAELRAAAKAARTPEEREMVVGAMGMFDDPSVLRAALDLGLTDEIRVSELRYLYDGALGRPGMAATIMAWEKEHWAALRERVGSADHGMLVGVVAEMCTAADAGAARAFFEDATKGIEGIKRELEGNLQTAELCAALRAHGGAAAAKRLKRP